MTGYPLVEELFRIQPTPWRAIWVSELAATWEWEEEAEEWSEKARALGADLDGDLVKTWRLVYLLEDAYEEDAREGFDALLARNPEAKDLVGEQLVDHPDFLATLGAFR